MDLRCPSCNGVVKDLPFPLPTVDAIIEVAHRKIVLIERKYPPYGWALPGGFINYGESAEEAAVRETGEETKLEVKLTGLMGVYSVPTRDPRFHTLSVVYTARGSGEPRAGDDAASVGVFRPEHLPRPIAFDHQDILRDYLQQKSSKENRTT